MAARGLRPDRRLVRTPAGYVHVRTLGSGAGVPLVLLHMSPLSGRMFDGVAPLLARTRRVVLPDRIGFGSSDPLPGRLTIEEVAATTLAALDAVGVVEFDVVGMHTGSCEAIELAVANPERVRRAGVVGIPHLTTAERSAFRTRCVPPRPTAEGSHLAWYWQLWTAVLRGSDPAQATDWMAQHLAAANAHWMFQAAFDYETLERLRAVRQPLLVVAARDELCEQTLRALPLLPPETHVARLDHVDSDALFDRAPAELARALTGFLR